MADGTIPADLGQVAFEAESAWLDEIMPGGPRTPWEALDPEARDVYQRLAGPVAAAERERIAQLAECRKATYPLYEQPGLIIGHPSFADLIRKGPGHG